MLTDLLQTRVATYCDTVYGRCYTSIRPVIRLYETWATRARNTGLCQQVKAGALRLGLGLEEYQAGPKAVSGPQHGSAWPGCESPKAGAWRPEAEAGTSLTVSDFNLFLAYTLLYHPEFIV